MIKEKISEYFLPVLSGVLLVLSFPKFDLFLFAWIALVPLFITLYDRDRKQAFWAGYAFGLAYFFGTLYWIYHSISVYGGVSFISSILIVLLLCLIISFYPAIFSWFFVSAMKKTKLPASLIAPVIWVVLEFIRSYAFTGFPWSSIGYSQYRFLQTIQVADITGIYGISFLVVAVNGSIADLFLLKRRIRSMPLFPLSYTVAGISTVVVLMIFTLVYGFWRLAQTRSGHEVTISVVQGNIAQDKKWEPQFQQETLDIYFDLSKRAASSHPQLIVWPETAVPFFFGTDKANTAKLADFEQGLGSMLLFGSVMVKDKTDNNYLLTNSAVLLGKEGKTSYVYDKIHLVPFGEYVPLRSILFFINKFVNGIGDYIPGRHYIRAETDFGSFGTLICYEIIFPGMVRKFFTKGGDFIVTITNDAWFGKTAGPYQHFSMAVFRAIENRKPVVRAANTGISGFIDSNGRIMKESRLFERTFLNETLKADGTLTVYTKYGDIFPYLCMVILIILSINIKIWR